MKTNFPMALCMLLVVATTFPIAAETTLSGYDWNGDAFALSERELLDMASDVSLPGYVRARAAYSLTQYPTDAVWNFFVNKLSSTDAIEVRRSVDNLCVTFKQDNQHKLPELLKPLLDSDDAQLRITSARCLQSLDIDSNHEEIEQ